MKVCECGAKIAEEPEESKRKDLKASFGESLRV